MLSIFNVELKFGFYFKEKWEIINYVFEWK